MISAKNISEVATIHTRPYTHQQYTLLKSLVQWKQNISHRNVPSESELEPKVPDSHFEATKQKALPMLSEELGGEYALFQN